MRREATLRTAGALAVGLGLAAQACGPSARVESEPAAPTDRDHGAELAYVTNQDDATVSIVDMERLEVVETIDLTELGYSPTAKPHHTAVEPDGSYWYVTLIADGRILKFDGENRLIGEASFETPGLLALDPTSDRMYVGRSMAAVNPPQRIGVIQRSGMSLEEVGVFFPRPHAITVHPDGDYVYTASLAENRLASLHVAEEALELIDVEGPHHSFVELAVSPDGRTLVATAEVSAELLVFDLSDPARPGLVERLEVNAAPWHPAFSPDGGELWFGNREANTVTVIDTRSWSVAAVIEGEGLAQPHGLAFSADGERVFVSNENRNGSWVPEGVERPEGVEGGLPGNVVAIDAVSREILEVIEVGRYASGMSTGIARPR